MLFFRIGSKCTPDQENMQIISLITLCTLESFVLR
jgi:hypothetical protein